MDASVWRSAPSERPAACWFYAAASATPALLDVPARGEWVRLCRSDCVALESRYGSNPELYDAAWAGATPPEADAAPPVLIRSGLYEADVLTRSVTPAYWEQSLPAPRLLRATWFVERSRQWEPCGLPLAEVLESAHRTGVWTHRAQHAGVVAARVNCATPGLQPGLHALFISEAEKFLVIDTLGGKLQHAMGLSGGDKAAPGLRLRRGWREEGAQPLGEEEAEDERAAFAPPTHLCFVTHGIGHRLEFVDVTADAAAFRRAARALAAQHVPPGGGRLVILPVQWRKSLDVKAERVLDTITPETPSLRPIRQVLNALVLDVLSYWTPTAQEMTDALTAALNAQHAAFLARCPGFAGPVSICAHSLGSVLAWDILRNQSSAGSDADASSSGHFTNDSPRAAASSYGVVSEEWSPGGGDPRVAALSAQVARLQAELAAARAARQHVYHPLSFKVATLVMLGSPLALFLTLQASEGGAAASEGGSSFLSAGVPACTRVINCIHPHDPIAYRLEPLLLPALAAQRPALVPYHRNNGRRLGVELTDRIEHLSSSLRGMSALSATALSKLGLSLRGGVSAPEEVPAAAPASAADEAARALLRRLAGCGAHAAEEEARVDWQLQAAEIDVPIFQAFTAHLAYWTSEDVALFVLRSCGPAPDVPLIAPMAAASPTKPPYGSYA